jgi:hypothetical protein
MNDATYGAGPVYCFGEHELTSGFSGVRVAQSVVFCVEFGASLLYMLSFIFWPLYCLPHF